MPPTESKTPKKKRPTWDRAIRKLLPILMVGIAVTSKIEWVSVSQFVMAYIFLWLEEEKLDKEKDRHK